MLRLTNDSRLAIFRHALSLSRQKQPLRVKILAVVFVLVAPALLLAEPFFISDTTTLTTIEQTLKKAEALYSDITPGTEKKIKWFNGAQQTDYSILYLHGFSATRQESAPLSDVVANALGANIFYTRLSGHGRGSAAMNDGNVARWQQDSKEAWKVASLLGKKIIVISMSTGSTLATWLNDQAFANNIAAQIMLSPNFALSNRAIHLLRHDWLRHLVGSIAGGQHTWQAINEQQERYWATTYSQESIGQMLKLVHEVQQIDLSGFDTPLFMIYAPKDTVISTSAAKDAYLQWGAKRDSEPTFDKKQLLEFNNASGASQHVLAGDIVSPASTQPVAQHIITFINELINR